MTLFTGAGEQFESHWLIIYNGRVLKTSVSTSSRCGKAARPTA
jgi:hypothetical protein